jgi:RHS repeat-associated protein
VSRKKILLFFKGLDYYAFGDPMVGRTFTGANGYRFGFNGKEKTDEVSGNGNNYDYGFRIYNPRLGKFLSVDPLTASYPGLTPYQFASNTPIMAIDVDGLEAKLAIIMEWGSPELAMQHKNALEKEGFKVQIVASGRDAINFLTDHKVKGGDPIEQLTIITHGFDESAGSLGLPGTNDESGIYSPLGFATLAKQVGEEIATKKGTDAGLNEWAEGVEKMKENGAVSSTELASAINEIGFTDNGKVLLTGCNVGVSQEIVNKRNGEGEKNPFRLEKNFANIFAQDLKHDVIAASASFKGTGTSSPFNLTKEGTLFRAAAKWTVFKPDGTTKPLKQGNVINISTSK